MKEYILDTFKIGMSEKEAEKYFSKEIKKMNITERKIYLKNERKYFKFFKILLKRNRKFIIKIREYFEYEISNLFKKEQKMLKKEIININKFNFKFKNMHLKNRKYLEIFLKISYRDAFGYQGMYTIYFPKDKIYINAITDYQFIIIFINNNKEEIIKIAKKCKLFIGLLQIRSNDEEGLESLGRPANEYVKKKFGEDNNSKIKLTTDGIDLTNADVGEKVGDITLLLIEISDRIQEVSMLVGKKKFDEKFKHVLGIIEYSQDRLEGEKVSLELITNKEGDPLSCMTLLGHDFHQMASVNLLVDKDIEKFRQNMYLSTKLCLLGSDTRSYLIPHVEDFFSALMSNNQDILEFFKKYSDILAYEKEKNFYKKSYSGSFLSRTVLLALKGEWEDVILRADLYLANPSKNTKDKYYYLQFEFLKALAEKNIEKMKESINTMLDLKVARTMVYNMDLYFDFYLQIYVLIYAKIALYHGIDLEVDSDIAPKELIDNTPAKEYPEPYEFMKKFDLKTITPEEWKAWIYEYHPEPEELKESEERGYIFV